MITEIFPTIAGMIKVEVMPTKEIPKSNRIECEIRLGFYCGHDLSAIPNDVLQTHILQTILNSKFSIDYDSHKKETG